MFNETGKYREIDGKSHLHITSASISEETGPRGIRRQPPVLARVGRERTHGFTDTATLIYFQAPSCIAVLTATSAQGVRQVSLFRVQMRLTLKGRVMLRETQPVGGRTK